MDFFEISGEVKNYYKMYKIKQDISIIWKKSMELKITKDNVCCWPLCKCLLINQATLLMDNKS